MGCIQSSSDAEMNLRTKKSSSSPPPLLQKSVILMLRGSFHEWEMLRFHHSAGFGVIPAYSTAVLRPCSEYGDVFLVWCSKSPAALLEKVPNRALRIISMECTPAPQLYFPKTTTTEQALHDLLPQARADSTHKPLLLFFFFFTHFYCRTLSRSLLVCSEEQKGTNA